VNCPNHPQEETIGYCVVCAAFGCAQCVHSYEGVLYCTKHFRPYAQKIEAEKKRDESRRRHPRQRMVVRYRDGKREYGVCYALNLKESGFHLDLVDTTGNSLGQTSNVQFRNLKAIFLVKSWDGKFDKTATYPEWVAEGQELVVKFKDGEMLRGFALRRHMEEEPRFYVIPAGAVSNNLAILIERDAAEFIYTAEEYGKLAAKERESIREEGAAPDLSQEETQGDFYFETKNYPAAMRNYQIASARFPQSRRLRKKILMAQYNVGVEFIKRHEYDKALTCLETILKTDPQNERVAKKVSQLRRIIEKGAKAGSFEDD
jgi:tetratricopeptide (TPR) repeat protein